jgi:hypothetical protein
MTFQLHRWNRLQVGIRYAWESARGTDPLHTLFTSSAWDTLQTRESVYPVDYASTHRGSVNVDYRFGENEGGPVFSGLGLNLLFTFSSGHPFTKSAGYWDYYYPGNGNLTEWIVPSQRKPMGDINSWTTPWIYSFDIRVNKTVRLGPLVADFYCYVQNVFNRKNVTNVYMLTGQSTNDGFLSGEMGNVYQEMYGPRFADLYNEINLTDNDHYRRATGKEIWGPPRQIRFGVKVEY